MRGRSDHSKAKPQMGCISALASRQAAYERVNQIFQRSYLQQHQILVTTSIIKSDAVPALRAGAGALFSGGAGAVVADLLGLGLEVCLIL